MIQGHLEVGGDSLVPGDYDARKLNSAYVRQVMWTQEILYDTSIIASYCSI